MISCLSVHITTPHCIPSFSPSLLFRCQRNTSFAEMLPGPVLPCVVVQHAWLGHCLCFYLTCTYKQQFTINSRWIQVSEWVLHFIYSSFLLQYRLLCQESVLCFSDNFKCYQKQKLHQEKQVQITDILSICTRHYYPARYWLWCWNTAVNRLFSYVWCILLERKGVKYEK